MPLTWDATKCDDLDFDDEGENVVTQTIVFMSAAVGMPRISERNWKEFYTRANFVDKLKGPFMYKGGERYSLTARDIYRRISLHTNASPEPTATWLKNLYKGFSSDTRWDLRSFEADQKDA